ncbi:DUF1043 family protein [Alteromonas sp. C1M14]|uniref:ZapG family protein n=1 Tax=Alteromonas sp. C1M14 TaxID=2841567 RepID=UPI001C095854|nr:DUF1043 family protein [Alteromonas sp. C1M14]MBU2977702.1 YhcB family protein [Alteromonas sp. C1M14]
MDVLIPVALLVVGLIIGFFAARFAYKRNGNATPTKQAEQNIKALMSQQASHHLHQTKQTVEAIEKHCETLQQQIADYETLLSQTDEDEDPKVPFYGEQASTYLRNNIKGREKATEKVTPETQPKDFANAGSGLFVGTSGQSTAEKD